MKPAATIRFPRSLKSKLLLPLLLTGIAIAALAIAGIERESRQYLEAQLQQRAELIAHMVNYAAESVSRPGELQRMVTAIGSERDVLDILVVGGVPSQVLASSQAERIAQLLTDLPDDAVRD
ncbi:MAG: hypothetical protein WCF18_14335, partial [Chthoniobacteraceae bacterium]